MPGVVAGNRASQRSRFNIIVAAPACRCGLEMTYLFTTTMEKSRHSSMYGSHIYFTGACSLHQCKLFHFRTIPS